MVCQPIHQPERDVRDCCKLASPSCPPNLTPWVPLSAMIHFVQSFVSVLSEHTLLSSSGPNSLWPHIFCRHLYQSKWT